MTENGGEDGHYDQSGEGGREDEETGMFHRHEGGDKEGLVADFREQDHCEGEDERVEGLY